MPPKTPRNSSNKHSFGSEPIDITKDEFNVISEAFKKEEFRKLFLEYCDEIQDPENRKKYEDEIKQFEAERGVEIQFVNPLPGFVVKTSADGDVKCFINIAKSDIVERPESQKSFNHETGTYGLNWSLPMAQTPPREDIDAKGKRCRVYDVVFHSNALYMAQRNKDFRKCLIDTALDAVEREFEVKLDRTNLKFPKLEFKGVARSTVIRKLMKNPPPEAEEPHPLESCFPPKPTANSKPKVVPVNANPKPKLKFTTPKYVIKHKHDVDLAEYTDELDARLNLTIPRQLIVEIELPLLKTTAECKLDITPKTLYLKSDVPGAKYQLRADLPYAVNDNEGSARFDVDKRRLSVTLPVIQKTVDEQREMHEHLLHLNREDSGVESDVHHSNSDSPAEELSDSTDEPTVDSNDENVFDNKAAITEPIETEEATTFLKNNVHYQFPEKHDCNLLNDVLLLVLHVAGVQADSVDVQRNDKSIHLQFRTIGSGFYPSYYAFYLELPEALNINITKCEAEAWDNNVVVNLNLSQTTNTLFNYSAGIDANDLKEYKIQSDKFEKTEHDAVVNQSNIDVFDSDDEGDGSSDTKSTENEQTNKENKKQRKRNKKRRSLSESACDDIKAAYEQEKQNLTQNKLKEQQHLAHANNKAENKVDVESELQTHNSNENNIVVATATTPSVPIPTSINETQKRKQRSYSECQDSAFSVSVNSGSNPTYKGILKHNSRYGPSISNSCSSIDESGSSYSCSADAHTSAHSFRFSQSFSEIPEEQSSNCGLSESCKKTVTFSDVIKKQVFRLDSSILGQRRKNQKRRDRKNRGLQRRHSEGDSADYEDNKPIAMVNNKEQYYKKNVKHKNFNQQNNNFSDQYEESGKELNHNDSGLDLSNIDNVDSINTNKDMESKKVDNNKNEMLSSESSSSDMEANDNADMMFELLM